MRLAVVKSALRSARRRFGRRLSAKSISRSMMAPLEMRPTVGTPRVIFAASPSAWKPPIASEPCADRIDVAVGAEQRRDQQRSALQALGVAQRRDGDVDARALRAEGRQVGGDHDGRDVAGAQRLAADVDAEAFQHRLQRLLGERDVVERVAGAVEADDEAVADQLVLPHALDAGEVLDARGGVRRRAARRAAKMTANAAIPVLTNLMACSPLPVLRVSQRAGCNGLDNASAVPTEVAVIELNCLEFFRMPTRGARRRAVNPCRSGQFLPPR